MTVLDEQLRDPEIAGAIRQQCGGSVMVVTQLLPGAEIDDREIPRLLRQRRGCTFVTINWSDFWRKVRPDRRFSVVCVQLEQRRVEELAPVLRRLFLHPAFRTQRQRCGKVILVAAADIRYYERLPGEVHEAPWR